MQVDHSETNHIQQCLDQFWVLTQAYILHLENEEKKQPNHLISNNLLQAKLTLLKDISFILSMGWDDLNREEKIHMLIVRNHGEVNFEANIDLFSTTERALLAERRHQSSSPFQFWKTIDHVRGKFGFAKTTMGVEGAAYTQSMLSLFKKTVANMSGLEKELVAADVQPYRSRVFK